MSQGSFEQTDAACEQRGEREQLDHILTEVSRRGKNVGFDRRKRGRKRKGERIRLAILSREIWVG